METYCLVGKGHELLDQSLLSALLALRGDHISTCLIEGMHLLGGQIVGDLPHGSHDLFDERLAFAGLKGDKVTFALVSDLDESVTCHILNPYWQVSNRSRVNGKERPYLHESRA